MKRQVILSKVIFLLLVISLLTGCSRGSEFSDSNKSDNKINIQILYLGHPPVMSIMKELDNMLTKYEDKVNVSRYTFESEEGASLADERNITDHTPMVIFVNGSMELSVGDRKVRFYSFPKGQGTFMVESGEWSIEDLEQVILQQTGR